MVGDERGEGLSEQTVEETPEEVDETEEEETEEEEQEEKPADDAAKLKKALARARADAKKARSELAEARKAASKPGDMGEAESLKEQLEELKQTAKINDAVAELFDNDFNGTKAQAQKMIKLVDLDDVEGSIEDLKEDFPERFGKAKSPNGPRPYTGGGRVTDTTPKDETKDHSLRLLGLEPRR
jgi:DNA repair exonuclease SbcCD ATPase subunit